MSARRNAGARRMAGARGGVSIDVSDVVGSLFEQVRAIFAGGAVFTADYYAVDGDTGNVAALVNQLDPSDLFSQSNDALRVSAPAPHAALKNARAYTVPLDAYYDSNRPASGWKYRHDGSGLTEYFVLVADANGTDRRVIVSTMRRDASTTQVGSQVYHQAGSGTWQVGRAATQRTIATTLTGSWTDGVAYALSTKYLEGNTPAEYVARRNGSSVASGDSSAAPSSADPAFTARLWGSPDGDLEGFTGAFAAYLTAPRFLSAAEDAIVNAYLAAKYGVSA